RSQASRASSSGGNQPDVRRRGRFRFQKAVVAHFERVEMFLDLLFVGGLVCGDVGDVFSVGAPSELLDAVGRIGDFGGVATAHGKYEKLRLFFLGWPDRRQKGKVISI